MLIVAGSAEQASYWARQLGYARNEWQYLAPHAIRGRMMETVFLVGTYQDRPDWPEVLMALEPTGAELILAEDMVPPHRSAFEIAAADYVDREPMLAQLMRYM
jgi:hypothetical protein